MAEEPSSWPLSVRLHEIQRSSPVLDLEADATRRASIARELGLVALDRFTAHVQLRPWLEGAEVVAHWAATVVQTCGVTADDFSSELSGDFTVRAVPSDSVAAPGEERGELLIDPDAEDPPDRLEGDAVDVGHYLVEHLALELDPFPRKPGAVYEPPAEERPASPFAALAALKPKVGDG